MSSFLAPSRTRARFAEAVQQRARLSLVPTGTTRAPRVPFAALVLTVLGLGLVGLLVLNTSLQQGAFHARDLEARAQTLSEKREALEIRVAQLRQPQRVAERAVAMGMVPNDSPAFLRLADGAVLGQAAPASAEIASFLQAPRAAGDSASGAGRTPQRSGGAAARDRAQGSSR